MDEPIPAAAAAEYERSWPKVLDALEQYEVDEALEHAHWTCDSDGAAEWAMRKLAEAAKRVAEAAQQHGAWVAELDRWLDDVTRADRRTIDFMTAQLNRYALERAENGGPATLRLPSGTVPTRDEKPKAEIVDDEAYIAWAEAHLPATVKVKKSPLVSELRKADGLTLGYATTDRVELWLSCEHVLITPESQQVQPGERVLCTVCGEPQEVEQAQPEQRRVVLVPSEDGEAVEVPGTHVDPGGRKPGSITLNR